MKAPPRLDEQLCFQLYTASRLVTRAYRPLLKPLNLTYPQYLVMMVLWERGAQGELPVSVGELGEELLLDSGTLTPLLKRMESNGQVSRQRSAQDERVVQVDLTAAGWDLATPAADIPEQLLCRQELSGELAMLADLRERLRHFVTLLRD